MAGVIAPDLNIAQRITEQGNSEMDGDNICTDVCSQTSPNYFRIFTKDWLKTNIDSLTDDIMSDILARLRAQDLRNSIGRVCRKWHHMIHTRNFVHAHLQHSNYGLLIQNETPTGTQLSFVAMRQGRIEISRLNYRPVIRIWSSCNGLILNCFLSNHYDIFIANPATAKPFALPPFSSKGLNASAIAYVATSMEYKVVRSYDSRSGYIKKQLCCAIMTVGVDKSWRLLYTDHLSLEAKECLCCVPLTTEGFVHWAQKGPYVLTLNVETEIVTQFPVRPWYGSGFEYYYFSGVKTLSLLIACREFLWEVWEMKAETGEWTMLSNIDLETQKCEIEELLCKRLKPVGSFSFRLVPVGWLKCQEVLVFKVSVFDELDRCGLCIAYNVHSKEIDLFELDSEGNTFLVHRIAWHGWLD